MISDHKDSSLPKNGRSEKGSFTMTMASPRAPGEKTKKKIKKCNNKLTPHREDKKKKQHKLGMNIRNVYISV